MKVLVNLVSGQVQQNIIPAIQMPHDKVVLLRTRDTVKQAELLTSSLKRIQPNLQIEELETDPFDIQRITEDSKTIVSSNNGNKLTLNYTGGTKQMSIGAYEVFRNANAALVYVDSQSDRIIVNESGNIHYERFNTPIKDIETYMLMRGIQHEQYLKDFSRVRRRELLTRFIAEYISRQKNIDLNAIRALLDNKVTKEFCQKYQRNITGLFKDDLDRRYYFEDRQGGWLEEWTFLNVFDSGLFDSVYINLKILNNNDPSRVENEMDVCALKDAVLNCFECKAGRFSPVDLIKLKNKKDRYGGKYSNGFVVCVKMPDGIDMELANYLDIPIFELISGLPLKDFISKFHHKPAL